jgi:hypothetical protein
MLLPHVGGGPPSLESPGGGPLVDGVVVVVSSPTIEVAPGPSSVLAMPDVGVVPVSLPSSVCMTSSPGHPANKVAKIPIVPRANQGLMPHVWHVSGPPSPANLRPRRVS